MTEVFIGKVKSKEFDYDKPGNWDGYSPDALCKPQHHSSLFWDILRESNAKQTDWGCYVVKMNKSELIDFLDNDKYRKYDREAEMLKELLTSAHTLSDMEEYLLTALEWDGGGWS